MPVPRGAAIYTALAIIELTWINLCNIHTGMFAQSWLTALEVGGLLMIVGAAFFLAGDAPRDVPQVAAGSAGDASFGMAMVFVLLTYGGWNEAAYISAEIKDGRLNMVKALTLSILIITGLYLMVIWAYWRGLGIAGIDLNPQRIAEARANAKQAGVEGKVNFKVGDLFKADFSNASVVTLYLLPEVNRRLRPQLWEQLKVGSRVVSHDFDMGLEWPPERTEQVAGKTVYFWTIKPENKAAAKVARNQAS